MHEKENYLNYKLTKILDARSPGIKPASEGTNIVAIDQPRTPISRTFLQYNTDISAQQIKENVELTVTHKHQ